MALIKCSECGKDISDKAPSCPNCGNPVVAQVVQTAKTVNESGVVRPRHMVASPLTLALAPLVLGLLWLCFYHWITSMPGSSADLVLGLYIVGSLIAYVLISITFGASAIISGKKLLAIAQQEKNIKQATYAILIGYVDIIWPILLILVVIFH